MKKKQDSNTHKDTNVNEDEAQRKNKIPKKVRNLFRIKKKASDSLKTVQSVKKCLSLRAKIESSEEELKTLYLERKNKLEEAAIAKIKRNPGAFFSYAKRQAKTFSGIGPFLKQGGEPLEENEAETLKKNSMNKSLVNQMKMPR